MNDNMQFYSGIHSIPLLFRLRLSMLKYLVQPKKYPLFVLQSSGKGLLSAVKMMKKLKICKLVKHNDHCYFSLTIPHWPSKAFDRTVAKGGLNITAAGTELKKQMDNVILAITPRCNYACHHCYEYYNLADQDKIPVARLIQVIKTLQEHGVSIITFSGGEPMLRYEGLLELLQSSDPSYSDFHIHTSGYGVTPEKAVALKKAGLQAAGIGLDDVNPEINDTFRGFEGAHKQAIKAIGYFQDAGVFTYVNVCLTRSMIRSGNIHRFLEMLKDLKVGIIRWLEPKPCGAFLNETAQLIEEEDRAILNRLYTEYNTLPAYRDYPMIVYDAYAEAPEHLGCLMAGHSLLYINSSGEVQPCVFLPITFGNILREDITAILKRMRLAVPVPLHTACPSIQLNASIRNKLDHGIPVPIPYEGIKMEFDSLIT